MVLYGTLGARGLQVQVVQLLKYVRMVENAFGHLKARFRRIGKGIDNKVGNAPIIVRACCVLHNFLNERNDNIYHLWFVNLKDFNRKGGINI